MDCVDYALGIFYAYSHFLIPYYGLHNSFNSYMQLLLLKFEQFLKMLSSSYYESLSSSNSNSSYSSSPFTSDSLDKNSCFYYFIRQYSLFTNLFIISDFLFMFEYRFEYFLHLIRFCNRFLAASSSIDNLGKDILPIVFIILSLSLGLDLP